RDRPPWMTASTCTYRKLVEEARCGSRFGPAARRDARGVEQPPQLERVRRRLGDAAAVRAGRARVVVEERIGRLGLLRELPERLRAVLVVEPAPVPELDE